MSRDLGVMMIDPALRTLLRRLALPIYIPTVLYSAGTATIVPVVPLVGLHLGLSVPEVALIGTIAGVLTVAGPLPMGQAVARIGERSALALGAAVAAVAVGGCLLAASQGGTDSPAPAWARVTFVGCILVLAVADLTWDLGRQIYLAEAVPQRYRARAMTLFGGMLRVGRIIGPAIGAAVITVTDIRAAFVVHLVAALIGLVAVLVFVPPGENAPKPAGDSASGPGQKGVLTPMILVGLAVIVLMAARANRDLLLPLLGHEYGHSAALVSLVFAVSGAAELLLILPAGSLMDRFGRAAVLVPCLIGVGIGFCLSPLAAGVPGFFAIALIFSIGNGLGAGINKTLSADLTPPGNRARWMGVWNSLTGGGQLVGPGIVTAATAMATVTVAGVATGVISLVGAAWAAYWLPRLVPGPRAADRKPGAPDFSR